MLWFPLLLIVLVLGVGFVRNAGPLLNGQFVGIDDYSRVTQVREFQRTGDWYQPRLPRSNTPFGEARTWSRPLDVLLLGGGLALAPALGFSAGLHFWALIISPLFLVATMLGFFWAVAPLLPRKGLMLLGVIMLTQPAVIAQFMIGRPDHHGFQALLFVLLLGCVIRIIEDPNDWRRALLAGFLAALALWTSIEALVIIAIAMATLAIHWYREGRDYEKPSLLFAGSLSFFVLAAVLAERPPGQWAAVEYDRISVVYLTLVALAALFWALVSAFRRLGFATTGMAPRIALSLAGAGLGLGVMWIFFADFFAGPMALAPAQVRGFWNSYVSEYSATIRPGKLAESIHFTLFYLGPALVAAAYLPVLAGRADTKAAWLFPAFALALFLPLGLYQIRWTIYAQLLALPIYSHLLLRLLDALKPAAGAARAAGAALKDRPVAGAFARAAVILLFVGGFTAMGNAAAWLGTVSGTAAPGQQAAKSCNVTAAARYLTRSARYGRRPQAIMTLIFAGPEIVYQTPHRVVATPNHRNAEGIVDTFAFFRAGNADEARAILVRRRIDLVMVCPGAKENELYRGRGEQTLNDRLLAGLPPPWLVPAPVGKDALGGFRLFEFRP